MYPPNTSNPEFAHDWHPVKDTSPGRTFGRAEWMVCKRCGIVMRSDGKMERCIPQLPVQNHSPLRAEGFFRV